MPRRIMNSFLSCFKKKVENEDGLQMVVLGDPLPVDDQELLVFELPAGCRIPQDTQPGATNYIRLMEYLGEVKNKTGFLEPLLIKLLVRGNFSSIRTSEIAFARGSLKDVDLITLKERIRAAFKSTEFGSKSNFLFGICEGKLARDTKFRAGYDPAHPENTPYDLKDNNALGRFPPDSGIADANAQLLHEYQQTISQNIQEVRNYEGLIYFAENVPRTERGKSTAKMHRKHYCQEAERLGSILFHLAGGIYKEPRIISQNKQMYIAFKDNNDNECRANLTNLILQPYVQNDPELQRVVKDFIHYASEPNQTIEAIMQYITTNEQAAALKSCHAPLFAMSDKDHRSLVPVMVQAGKNGEAIIRDADFQHFYKHQLMPPLALKTFNGATDYSKNDFWMGLELMRIRLQSPTLTSFIANLNEYIADQNLENISIHKEALDSLGITDLQCPDPNEKGVVTINNFRILSDADKRRIVLAKYNDFSTLRMGMPYINYTKIDFFKKYTEKLLGAIEYYDVNIADLMTVGQSSVHSLVMLYDLQDPMAMHGDEADHPRVKPEKTGRITTHVNGKFIVTKDEDQYLKLLFTNPQILDQTTIKVHPYWLRTKDLDDNGEPVGYERNVASKAMYDLLSIQVMKQAILMAQTLKAQGVRKPDLMSCYDMYAEIVIANMNREFVKNDGEKKFISDIKVALAKHFQALKDEISQSAKKDKPGLLAKAMQGKIAALYAQSPYNDKRSESRYNAYTSKPRAARLGA